MKNADFCALGQAIFGEQWVSPLAQKIGVSLRHMQRVAAGDSPVAAGIYAETRALAVERGAALASLLETLPESIPDTKASGGRITVWSKLADTYCDGKFSTPQAGEMTYPVTPRGLIRATEAGWEQSRALEEVNGSLSRPLVWLEFHGERLYLEDSVTSDDPDCMSEAAILLDRVLNKR